MKIINHNHFDLEGAVRVILYEYDKDGNLKVMHQYDAANFVQAVNALIYHDNLPNSAKIVIERSDLIK